MLIYSRGDGEEFGKLIATELVESFCQEYGEILSSKPKHGGLNHKRFDGFESKIATAIKNSVSPVLEFLQSQKSINLALLYTSDQLLPHNHRVDAISFVAEYRSLKFHTKQLMELVKDSDSQVIIQCGNDSTVIIKKIYGNAQLVVSANQSNDRSNTMKVIEKYSKILSSLLKLIGSLGNSGNDTFQWGALI